MKSRTNYVVRITKNRLTIQREFRTKEAADDWREQMRTITEDVFMFSTAKGYGVWDVKARTIEYYNVVGKKVQEVRYLLSNKIKE